MCARRRKLRTLYLGDWKWFQHQMCGRAMRIEDSLHATFIDSDGNKHQHVSIAEKLRGIEGPKRGGNVDLVIQPNFELSARDRWWLAAQGFVDPSYVDTARRTADRVL